MHSMDGTATTMARPRGSLVGAAARGMGFGLLACTAYYFIHMFVGSNLHIIVPGQFYRASQIDEDCLKRLVERHGIRTVVNLRGYCEDLGWYQEECRATSHLGVSQEDLNFSANLLPPPRQIRRLIDIIDHSEKPILFHCYRGVDRTGLASVLCLLLATDTPFEEARRSLSLRYLHLPFGRTGNLDRFLDSYADWLAAAGWEHSPDRFRFWATKEYRGAHCAGRIELLGIVRDQDGAVEPVETRYAFTGPNGRQCVRIPIRHPVGLRVRCHNTSSETWHFHPNDTARIHVTWRLVNALGQQIGQVERAGRYHATVPAGGFIDQTTIVPALKPGKYHYQINMVDEQLASFHEINLDPLNLELEVE